MADDGDDFGDFDEAPAPIPASSSGGVVGAAPAVAPAPPPPAAAPAAAAAAADDDDDDDDFGDFDEAQPAAVAPPPPAPAKPPAAAAVPAAAVPAPVAEAPDIGRLEGQAYLDAVLDAWEPLGARREYKAAAAAAAVTSKADGGNSNSSRSGGDADSISILACNGLPMPADSSGGFQPGVTCPHTLDWRDTPIEARMLESLGLAPSGSK